ncbi:MAG: aminopeptidase P family protein [Chloroflexi bacterium]|nr:aminopeptidase P family protein [Chloroflexota bacterium]
MTYGKAAVDWQQRVDFDRLRKDRLARAHQMLHKWGIGASVVFNWDSGRYLGRPWNHPYARHIPWRFVLIIRDAGFPYYPIAKFDTQVFADCPWLKDRLVREDVLCNPGIIFNRPWADQEKRWARFGQQVADLLKAHGVSDLPIGVDYASPIVIDSLTKAGLKVVDGNAWAVEATTMKTDDEIELMRMSATCDELGFARLAREFMPGQTEDHARALVASGIFDAGAEFLEGWVTESGPRIAPRGFNWSDRVVRPGEFLTLEPCHVTYMGYKVCYSRTFLVGTTRPTPIQKALYETVAEMQQKVAELLKPGITNHEWTRIRPNVGTRVFKGVADIKEFRATIQNHFGGMGIRYDDGPQTALDEPEMVLEKNMCVAYAPQIYVPGVAGAKIENTYRITDDGCESFCLWPYEDMPCIGL